MPAIELEALVEDDEETDSPLAIGATGIDGGDITVDDVFKCGRGGRGTSSVSYWWWCDFPPPDIGFMAWPLNSMDSPLNVEALPPCISYPWLESKVYGKIK